MSAGRHDDGGAAVGGGHGDARGACRRTAAAGRTGAKRFAAERLLFDTRLIIERVHQLLIYTHSHRRRIVCVHLHL